MPNRCSPSIAQALLPKGPSSDIVGMVVLVAALELEREVATIACGLICQMLVRPELPLEVASSAEEALLRYQAVPRLCKLLGADLPALPVPEADLDTGTLVHKVSTYRWFGTEFTQKLQVPMKSPGLNCNDCTGVQRVGRRISGRMRYDQSWPECAVTPPAVMQRFSAFDQRRCGGMPL